MSSLFKKDCTYTPDGVKLSGEAMGAITEIFADWTQKGYSPREIGHIIYFAVLDTECRFCVREQFKNY